ncbi:SUMO1 sentrin specific peptidase 1 [Homalodisca vitripennis]|nr:SUMO1 sentrin specific peptidase 1 [Homalodisca vitripennis]
MARVVRKHIRLLPSDSERLFSGKLLNGEIISAYLLLLERRNARDCNLPNVLALDIIYFFSVLKRSGHERARGHHRDQELLAYEIILVPVHEELADFGHWWLLVLEPKKATISAYDSLKGINHKPAMDLLRDYVKKEEIRAQTEARSWCLYGGRTCPSQGNLVYCRVFLCAIAGAICGAREAKELQVHGRELWRQMARELRVDSVTEIKSSQLELFPGEEPDWSLDDLPEELERLTDPTKWSLRLPSGEETPEGIGALQEKVDSVNPPEGAAGTSSGDMEIDTSPKPTLPEIARVSPMDEGDIFSLSPGWSMGSSIEIIPDPEEEECIRVAPSVISQPEDCATQKRMGDPPEQPHCTKPKRTRSKRRTMTDQIPGTNHGRGSMYGNWTSRSSQGKDNGIEWAVLEEFYFIVSYRA